MDAFGFIRHYLKPVPRFWRMVQVLDVRSQIEALPDSGAVLRRAETRCEGCSEPQACAAWLDGREAASEAPEYCRNHDLFERLIEQIERETQPA
jgi:hypothetical protein